MFAAISCWMTNLPQYFYKSVKKSLTFNMSRKEKFNKREIVVKKTSTYKKNTAKNSILTTETTGFDQLLTPLMPELEALVKKDPNRLLGCGG